MSESKNDYWFQSIRMLRACLAVLLGFILAACKDSSMDELKQFVATAYAEKKPEIEPLPEIPPYQKFEYSAEDQSDPFDERNVITDRPQNTAIGKNPDTNRPREELENYPLDALRFVGTIIQERRPYVIVQTTEGRALKATIGNYMGENEGQIKQIIPTEQKVVLAELVQDPSGRWVTQEVEMTIDE